VFYATSPNSNKQIASTQLGRWVRQHEKLQMQLLAMGYKPGKKNLRPAFRNVNQMDQDLL